jgi:hypothetical protein
MNIAEVPPGQVEVSQAVETHEPHEDLLVPNGQGREIVLGRMGHEVAEQGARCLGEERDTDSLEGVTPVRCPARQEVVDADQDDAVIGGARIVARSVSGNGEAGVLPGRLEEEHVVGVDHRRVRGLPLLAPNGSAVEVSQAPSSR